MRAGLAFYRLLWRPLSLFAAWWLFSIGPILVMTATDGHLSEAFRMLREGPAAAGFGLLGAGMLALPACGGLGAGAVILELQWSPFAWMLPRLRRILFVSVVPFAVLVSVPGAALAPSLGTGVAILVLGLAAFGLGLTLVDFSSSAWVSRAAMVALLAAGLAAAALLSFALSHPAGAVVIVLPVAAVLIQRAFSLGPARARPVRALPVVYASTVGLSATDGTALWRRLRAWSADGRGPVLGLWLGAVLFEKQRRWFGPSPREVGMFTLFLLMFIGMGANSEPSFNYIVPLSFLATMRAVHTAPYLEPGLLQPLTRRQRARIEYVASTLDQLHQLVALGLLIAVVSWPLTWFLPDMALGTGEILRVLAAAFIASPLIQHLRLGGRFTGRSALLPRAMVRWFSWSMGNVVVLTLVWYALGRIARSAGDAGTGRLLAVGTALALLAASQAGYASWLFRLHRRGDLI